jgi:hypothetical protein
MNEQELITMGHETYESFLAQFDGPNDVFKQILVEELIKIVYELYYKKPWTDED